MPVPVVGPCEQWTSDAEITACCSPPVSADLVAAADFASQVLFGLSGRQYPGACTETRRPCSGSNCGCVGASTSWWWGWPSFPARDAQGSWQDIGCCTGQCFIDCIKLPGPINAVTGVLVDGVALLSSEFAVNGFFELCRIGANWPCSQDFSKPVTEPGTWEVSWTRGKPISPAMRGMATQLACEFISSTCGGESCLPPNVSDIVRDGVSVSFEDTALLFENGKTGIGMIDLWLGTVNPKKIARRGSVHRADDPARKAKRLT